MTATDRLTRRQRQVLEAIVKFSGDRGYPPTVRELCKRFGMASPNAIWTHLQPLRRHGMVSWTKGAARTLRVTEAAVEALSEKSE